jgi:hypothetical protein
VILQSRASTTAATTARHHTSYFSSSGSNRKSVLLFALSAECNPPLFVQVYCSACTHPVFSWRST